MFEAPDPYEVFVDRDLKRPIEYKLDPQTRKRRPRDPATKKWLSDAHRADGRVQWHKDAWVNVTNIG